MKTEGEENEPVKQFERTKDAKVSHAYQATERYTLFIRRDCGPLFNVRLLNPLHPPPVPLLRTSPKRTQVAFLFGTGKQWCGVLALDGGLPAS